MDTLPDRVSPQLLNKALGYGTYGLITYQFLQTIFFASNLSMKFPSLSYLFPHSVDDEFHNWRSVWSWQYNHPLLNNVLLMALFGLQHSLQARLWFQKGISRNLSPWMERLLYVAGSSITFSLMMSFWQPMVFPVVWDFTGTALGSALNGLFLAGLTWTLITLWYDAAYDLFDFRKSFGEQVAAPGIPDYLPPVYRAIRQPLFMGVLLCYWASPFMTAGHFLFAGLMTLYTMSAVQYQERDKLTRQGAQYAEYQRRVPLYWPSLAALFNESSSITLPGAVEEKFKGAAGDRPPVVSPIDVHRYQHVGTR